MIDQEALDIAVRRFPYRLLIFQTQLNDGYPEPEMPEVWFKEFVAGYRRVVAEKRKRAWPPA
jgi:hypothetical protein